MSDNEFGVTVTVDVTADYPGDAPRACIEYLGVTQGVAPTLTFHVSSLELGGKWENGRCRQFEMNLAARVAAQFFPKEGRSMATKTSATKKSGATHVSLPELLNIVEKDYDPHGILDFKFEEITGEDGKIPEPSLTTDTLAEFLIRELGDIYDPLANAATNIDVAMNVVHSAIEQLRNVEAALWRANNKEPGYAVAISSKTNLHRI